MSDRERTAWFGFTGMIEPSGVGRIAGALNSAVNGGAATVHLSFSSNGGYVADGIYLHNHIRALPLHLVIYNTGSVGSIAVSVFLAAHERYCSQHAMFMIHPTTMSQTVKVRREQCDIHKAGLGLLVQNAFGPELMYPLAVKRPHPLRNASRISL